MLFDSSFGQGGQIESNFQYLPTEEMSNLFKRGNYFINIKAIRRKKKFLK